MEYKFLSDGRKVAIIGALNNTEWIVQEVFISASGDEIPSGERFVTKSLHDKPVESYKARQEKQLQEAIDKLDAKKKMVEVDIRNLESQRKYYSKALKSTENLYNKLSSSMEYEDFELMCDVMTGNVKWAVKNEYWFSEPISFMKSISGDGNTYYGEDELKLITLFGKSDGSLSYRINRYSDGSGNNTEMVFLRTDEELAEHYTNRISNAFKENRDRVRKEDIDIVLKYKGTVDQEIIDYVNDKEVAALQKRVDEAKELLQKQLNALEEYNQKGKK